MYNSFIGSDIKSIIAISPELGLVFKFLSNLVFKSLYFWISITSVLKCFF
jgi:hypothetical protein